MPNDSLTLRQAVVLGFLSEEELRSALDRSGDPAQALAELATSGRLTQSQITEARSVSSAGQMTQKVASTPTLVASAGSAPTVTDGSLIGKVIAGCRIEGTLGAGGMGAVYRAHHLGLDKRVALKILPPHFARSQELIDRFFREARAVAKLDHPNIVGVLNVGLEHGLHFIVMPVIEGESLSDRLARGPLPPDEVIRIARGIAEGLTQAHGNGIVHRDIKPENILIAKDGVPKIIDFGLAREAQPTGLTEAGQLLGTPHYMAPEQCRGERADARSDIYALGATMYHALTGRLPHEAKSLYDLLDQIVKTRPKSPHEINPAVPQNLSLFVSWMMEPDRTKRPAAMTEVSSGLASLQRGSIVAVPAPSKPPASPFRWSVAVTALLLVAIIAWGAIHKVLRRNNPSPTVPGTTPQFSGNKPEDPVKPPPKKEPVRKIAGERKKFVPITPKAHAPPNMDRNSILIRTYPEDAIVTIDNIYTTMTVTASQGEARFDNLITGAITVWVEAPGFEPREEGDYIHPKMKGMEGMPEYSKNMGLDPIQAEVWVDSVPDGATVILDDKPFEQKTPCSIKEVVFGPHKMRFEMAGWEADELSFDVDTSDKIEVTAEMRKKP